MFRFSLNLILIHIFALQGLCQVMDSDTEEPLQYLKRVIFLAEIQEYDSALTVLDSLEEFGPVYLQEGGFLSSLRLMIYDKSGDCKSAIPLLYERYELIFNEPFNLRNSEDLIYRQLRDNYYCVGELDSAALYGRILLRKETVDPLDVTILCRILMEQKKTKDALVLIRTIEVLNNDAPLDAVIIAASLLNTEGHSKEAKELLEPELKWSQYKESKEANTVMGDIYLSLGEKELACTQFKKVKSSDPISFSNHPNNGDYKYVRLVTSLMELEEKIIEACR